MRPCHLHPWSEFCPKQIFHPTEKGKKAGLQRLCKGCKSTGHLSTWQPPQQLFNPLSPFSQAWQRVQRCQGCRGRTYPPLATSHSLCKQSSHLGSTGCSCLLHGCSSARSKGVAPRQAQLCGVMPEPCAPARALESSSRLGEREGAARCLPSGEVTGAPTEQAACLLGRGEAGVTLGATEPKA